MIEKLLILGSHVLPTDLVNETTGLLEGISIWAYNVTNGVFWAALLLGFCVVMGIAASRYTSDRAFGFAGVIGIFGSMFLVTLNLISWWFASLFIIVGAILVVTMIISKR